MCSTIRMAMTAAAPESAATNRIYSLETIVENNICICKKKRARSEWIVTQFHCHHTMSVK